MDSIALRNALISAINTAKLPHDLPPILMRQGIEICFLRGVTLKEIEAISVKSPDHKDWLMSDGLGPDLAWSYVAVKKGWKHPVTNGLPGAPKAIDSKNRLPKNKIEAVLDQLADQSSPLAAALRQLIIKIVNSFLIHAEKTFRASLPRLKEMPYGVTRVPSSLEVQLVPSADCLNQTSRHLNSLLDGIQARDPVRITLPLAMNGMSEIYQALRDLKIQESKTPAQLLEEQEALAQAELDAAKKHLSACAHERCDVIALVTDCKKGKKITDSKLKIQLRADADAKFKMAERQVELARSKYPQLWHDPNGDAQLLHIEQPRG